jgi:hypothetical protein
MRKGIISRAVTGHRNVANRGKALVRNKINTSSSTINKLVDAAGRFGNPGIKNQQLTTFEIYDYLPYAPGTTLNFFQNVSTRQFPFTNIQENRLQVGESMVIKRIWFTVITVEAETGNIDTLQTFSQASLTMNYLAQFSWSNDNNRVMKDLSLTNQMAEFNRKGYNADNNVFHLETDITIQPLVRFTCPLTLPAGAAVANAFVGCHAGGVGTLLAPKGTF